MDSFAQVDLDDRPATKPLIDVDEQGNPGHPPTLAGRGLGDGVAVALAQLGFNRTTTRSTICST
jgi:hypothetical protein